MSDHADVEPPNVEPRSLEQKAALCSGIDMWHLEPLPHLGLGSVMVTDGPHGLRKKSDTSGLRGEPATCFPTAPGLAATWDVELVREVGAALGSEASATDVGVVLGPGINIKRHPLGGRNFEYFSEDPLLSGELAAAMIDGIQSAGVGASLKHFAVNNQESNRLTLDAVVDERTLREIYLAGFERAVVASRPWTVMCAYNKLNGVYCSEHRWLLTQVLRDEWGFDGLVMTDWGAANDRPVGVHAGLDLEMPGSGGVNDAEIVAAVNDGRLSEADVDNAAGRVAALVSRAVAGAAETQVDPQAHHELARRVAADSAVLLTNDGILPLQATASVAVIGGFATKPRYQGAGSSLVTPTQLDNFLEAAQGTVQNPELVHFAQGYDPTSDDIRPDLIDEARLVARSCDVAVVMVGLPVRYESEAYDRDHLRLPEQHNRLVEAVVASNPNTVVVLCNGAPVQLPWVDLPRAIVEAYLGGQAGGSGAADVVWGSVNPGGKLAETFALRASDHGSDSNFPGGPRQVQYREGLYVGYRWFDKTKTEVLFPFGHGLSYTTFELSDLAANGDSDVDGDEFSVSVDVTVTNTGDRAGAEVVQLYVRDIESTVHRPDRELKAFKKVHLAAGASDTVKLRLDRRSFAYYDVSTAAWQVEAGTFELLVGVSSRDIRCSGRIELASAFTPATPNPLLGHFAAPNAGSLDDDEAFAALLGHPIPEPTPVMPFNRNSTFVEVGATPVGRLLGKQAAKEMHRAFGGTKADKISPMLQRAVGQMPLRSMVLFTGGKVDWKNLDRIIRAINLAPGVRTVR